MRVVALYNIARKSQETMIFILGRADLCLLVFQNGENVNKQGNNIRLMTLMQMSDYGSKWERKEYEKEEECN